MSLKLAKIIWGTWGILLLLIIFAPSAPPKNVSRKYWPMEISVMAAENPREWHHMHTHVEVKGYVTFKKREEDADIHHRICDSPDIKEMDRAHCIIAECIPKLPCATAKVGDMVMVRGISRFDDEGSCVPNGEHCWWEIHLVEEMRVIN